MDITIYLPDELGQWAKDAGLNLSQTLRSEVEAERHRRTAVDQTLESAGVVHLHVDGPGRLAGRLPQRRRLHPGHERPRRGCRHRHRAGDRLTRYAPANRRSW